MKPFFQLLSSSFFFFHAFVEESEGHLAWEKISKIFEILLQSPISYNQHTCHWRHSVPAQHLWRTDPEEHVQDTGYSWSSPYPGDPEMTNTSRIILVHSSLSQVNTHCIVLLLQKTSIEDICFLKLNFLFIRAGDQIGHTHTQLPSGLWVWLFIFWSHVLHPTISIPLTRPQAALW